MGLFNRKNKVKKIKINRRQYKEPLTLPAVDTRAEELKIENFTVEYILQNFSREYSYIKGKYQILFHVMPRNIWDARKNKIDTRDYVVAVLKRNNVQFINQCAFLDVWINSDVNSNLLDYRRIDTKYSRL